MKNQKMGEFIANLRKEKEMTQKTLAEKLYVTDRAVSKWERGLNYPDITLLEKLSEILEISVNELLNGEKINDLTREKADDVLKTGIKAYKKQTEKKLHKKIGLGIGIFLILSTIFLVVVSELNYGEVSLGIIKFTFPNISMHATRKKTDKFMKALKEQDYETLEKIVSPQKGTYKMLLKNTSNEESRKLYQELIEKSYHELLEEFYEEVEIINYKREMVYYNGNNYAVSYNIKIKIGNEELIILPTLIGHQENITLSSFGWKDTCNDFINKNPETWNTIKKIFMY